MRTLIGLAILLVVILGLVWYIQRDSSFVKNLFDRSETAESGDAEEGTESGDMVSGENGETAESLLTCTPELFAADCATQSDPVCSVDVVVRGDGSETTSRTEYISACHYCKFFGPDNMVELGDERVESRGYTAGSCGISNEMPSDQKGGN